MVALKTEKEALPSVTSKAEQIVQVVLLWGSLGGWWLVELPRLFTFCPQGMPESQGRRGGDERSSVHLCTVCGRSPVPQHGDVQAHPVCPFYMSPLCSRALGPYVGALSLFLSRGWVRGDQAVCRILPLPRSRVAVPLWGPSPAGGVDSWVWTVASPPHPGRLAQRACWRGGPVALIFIAPLLCSF